MGTSDTSLTPAETASLVALYLHRSLPGVANTTAPAACESQAIEALTKERLKRCLRDPTFILSVIHALTSSSLGATAVPPSEGILRLHRVKHSWIENRILFLKPDDISKEYMRDACEELVADFGENNNELLVRVRDYRSALDPASVLVGDESLHEFRSAVSAMFAQANAENLDELDKTIEVAKIFHTEVEIFMACCRSRSFADAAAAARAWELLRTEAEGLRERLNRLPRGIWLP